MRRIFGVLLLLCSGSCWSGDFQLPENYRNFVHLARVACRNSEEVKEVITYCEENVNNIATLPQGERMPLETFCLTVRDNATDNNLKDRARKLKSKFEETNIEKLKNLGKNSYYDNNAVPESYNNSRLHGLKYYMRSPMVVTTFGIAAGLIGGYYLFSYKPCHTVSPCIGLWNTITNWCTSLWR